MNHTSYLDQTFFFLENKYATADMGMYNYRCYNIYFLEFLDQAPKL